MPQVPAETRSLVGEDAETELGRMGLSSALLVQACVDGLRAADNQHDPFEPAISLGFQRWSKTVGALRAALEELGWTKHDHLNAPRSVSPDGTVAIAVIGGNQDTGDPGHKPENARARGAVMLSEVQDNAARRGTAVPRQLTLDLGDAPLGPAVDARAVSTWILLNRVDAGARVLRCELSLPLSCHGGVVDQWARRIILPEAPLDGIAVDGRQDGGILPSDDVDFEVTAVG